MTDPKENIEYCFPETLNIFRLGVHRNQKCHMLQFKNSHKNIFGLKFAEKLEYSASAKKDKTKQNKM